MTQCECQSNEAHVSSTRACSATRLVHVTLLADADLASDARDCTARHKRVYSQEVVALHGVARSRRASAPVRVSPPYAPPARSGAHMRRASRCEAAETDRKGTHQRCEAVAVILLVLVVYKFVLQQRAHLLERAAWGVWVARARAHSARLLCALW